MQRAILVGLFSLICSFSLAQVERDSSIIDLDSIIVFGVAENKLHRLTSSSPFLSGTEDNIINALDHLSGIRKIHENGYPLILRGMFGNRIRIERNGVLKTGIVNQGYLMNDINPDNIEGIRVVSGAEKILFGSGSLGGIIQFQEKGTPSETSNSLFTKYSTNNSSKTVGLSVNHSINRLGFRFSARKNKTDNFRYATGETANNSGFNQTNLRLSTSFNNKNGNLKVNWNNEYSNGEFERPQGFQNNPFELRNFKNNYTYQSDLQTTYKTKDGLDLIQNLWGVWLNTDQNRVNYNGDYSSINSQEIRTYDKKSFGYRANIELQQNQKWKTRFGVDFISSWLYENVTTINNIDPSFSGNSNSERNEKMLGFFSLIELKASHKLTYRLSARGDLAQIGDSEQHVNFSALTGGIEIKWRPISQLSQQISLTRGFRYPTQNEAVGILIGGRGTFFGNPDIQPEFNHELEWQIVGITNQWEYQLSSWLSLFNNRITEIQTGNNEFTYQNIERARTFGLEAVLSRYWSFSDPKTQIKTSLSSSFIQGDQLPDEEGIFSSGEPLIGIPPLRLRFDALYNLSISKALSSEFGVNIDRISALQRLPNGPIRQTWAVQETDSYWLVGLLMNWKWNLPKHDFELGVTVDNLTNSIYYPFGARIMGMGRNIGFNFKFLF